MLSIPSNLIVLIVPSESPRYPNDRWFCGKKNCGHFKTDAG